MTNAVIACTVFLGSLAAFIGFLLNIVALRLFDTDQVTIQRDWHLLSKVLDKLAFNQALILWMD